MELSARSDGTLAETTDSEGLVIARSPHVRPSSVVGVNGVSER